MIHYVSTARFNTTIRKLIAGLGQSARGLISHVSYEELFFERAAPVGHYIFTDFDRLSRYEADCAAAVALAVQNAAPETKMLNHPLRACERVPLLHRLHERGFNDFPVVRLDTGVRPTSFPVFLRSEDGYGGPETGLIRNDQEFDAAIGRLSRSGLPLKGRIAIGYAGERGSDGIYRKYGAFGIAGEIVPQHLMQGEDWVVKKNSALTGPASVQEELEYVRENPHRELLQSAFRIGNLDFGRVDYGFFRGKLQVFEINTNPSFPDFAKSDARSERRRLIRERFVRALQAIDTPHESGRVRFAEARPRAHDLRLPRSRLPASVARRIWDSVTGLDKPVKSRLPSDTDGKPPLTTDSGLPAKAAGFGGEAPLEERAIRADAKPPGHFRSD